MHEMQVSLFFYFKYFLDIFSCLYGIMRERLLISVTLCAGEETLRIILTPHPAVS